MQEVGGSIPPGSTSLRWFRQLRLGKPHRSQGRNSQMKYVYILETRMPNIFMSASPMICATPWQSTIRVRCLKIRNSGLGGSKHTWRFRTMNGQNPGPAAAFARKRL
jgi:hypothetical protein